MIELVILAVLAIIGGAVHVRLRHHPDYRLDRVLERSFAGLRFPLRDGGYLPGHQVRVVQQPDYLRPGLKMLRYNRTNSPDVDSFWYCAGPDGHFWLAIAQHQRQWFLWRVHWIVRPLTAERLRNALQDDPTALQLAFGEVQVDRLYA